MVLYNLLWSHIGHIPDLLAQVLLPLLTSGEMEVPAVNPQFFLFRPHWSPLCWYHLVAEKLAFKKSGISQGAWRSFRVTEV